MATFRAGIVELWDVLSERKKCEFRGHTSQVLAVAFSPNGRVLASASRDGTIRLWDVFEGATEDRSISIWMPKEGARSAFSPDGKFLASFGAAGTTIQLLEMSTDRVISIERQLRAVPTTPQEQELHACGPNLAFSPHGKLLAATNSSSIELWDSTTLKLTGTLDGHTLPVTTIAFSPDGTFLASGGADMTIKLWEIRHKISPIELGKHTGKVWCLAFSPDGRMLASASGSRNPVEIKIWDVGSRKVLRTFLRDSTHVRCVCFSPDGKSLAVSGGNDDQAEILDATSGREICRLKGHISFVPCITFSPDGRSVATASRDGTIRLWDPTDGSPRAVLKGRPANWVAFSPNGSVLASAEDIGTLRLWRVAARKRRSPPTPIGRLNSIALQSVANWSRTQGPPEDLDNNLAELPVGEQTLVGVRYRIGESIIQLGSQLLPGEPLKAQSIAVAGRVARLYILHGSQTCSDRYGVPDGTEVAQYRVNYEDGGQAVIPVVCGEDVRDWWDLDNSNPVSRGWVVWSGSNARSRRSNHFLRLYLTVWENRQPEKKVMSVDYLSTNTNASPFCVAITAEKPAAASPPPSSRSEIPAEATPLSEIRRMLGQMPEAKFLAKGSKASWSPDGMRICFGTPEHPMRGLKDTGVWLLDLRSGQVTELLDSGRDPAWSPTDEQLITFVCGEAEAEEIWLTESSGQKPRKVADGDFPAWSADGKSLFFRSRGDFKLMSVDIGSDASISKPREVASVGCRFPAVSPDGKHVACRLDRKLLLMDLRTGKEMEKWPLVDGAGFLAGWSPEGKKFAFGGFGHSDPVQFSFVSIENRQMLRLQTQGVTMPAWSPDGSKLAFDLRFAGGSQIWMIESRFLPDFPRGRLSFVDLQPKANWSLAQGRPERPDNNLAELPQGEHTFLGVRLQIGSSFILLGNDVLSQAPLEVEGIQVNARAAKLYILHAIQFSQRASDGTTVGQYRVHYDDGSQEVIPVVAGEDVRDWWNVYQDQGRPAKRARVAWTGSNPDARRANRSLRLYLSVWENPRPDKKIMSLDYVSTRTGVAPFCVAITAEEPTSGEVPDGQH